MTRPMMLGTVLALSACLGCMRPSPAVVFHTLHPLRPQEGAPTPRSSMAVEVLALRLPEVLQRPQLVTAQGPDHLGLDETHRWGNPLGQEMQRVLVENLSQLLGSDAVVASPYGERVKAAYRVEVDVQRCDARPGALTLQATWMVSRPSGGQALLLRKTTLEEPLKGPDPDALVEAHSQVLAALSREIASGLKTLAGEGQEGPAVKILEKGPAPPR